MCWSFSVSHKTLEITYLLTNVRTYLFTYHVICFRDPVLMNPPSHLYVTSCTSGQSWTVPREAVTHGMIHTPPRQNESHTFIVRNYLFDVVSPGRRGRVDSVGCVVEVSLSLFKLLDGSTDMVDPRSSSLTLTLSKTRKRKISNPRPSPLTKSSTDTRKTRKYNGPS